ncbi:MAG: hypothetical protein M0038_21345 [Pseudomonadota bacterium]|jgi:hypothetical protein|nr:hypothetical protein [Pseudomonadota bacterium]
MSAAPIEFESAFPLADSTDRLKAITRSIFSLSAMGRVSARRVVLQRGTPLFRSSLKPFFIGRSVEREDPVFLVRRLRMLRLVRIVMTFWLGAVSIGALSAVSSRTPAPERAHELLMGVIMLATGVALVGVGRWLSRNDPAWLSHVIGDALSAEKSAPVVVPLRVFAGRNHRERRNLRDWCRASRSDRLSSRGLCALHFPICQATPTCSLERADVRDRPRHARSQRADRDGARGHGGGNRAAARSDAVPEIHLAAGMDAGGVFGL